MPSIDSILSRCVHQLGACHRDKAREIDCALHLGVPFPALGGKRVRSRVGWLRFKLGSEWRLLYRLTTTGYELQALVSRQGLERELKRRRAIKACTFHSQEKHP